MAHPLPPDPSVCPRRLALKTLAALVLAGPAAAARVAPAGGVDGGGTGRQWFRVGVQSVGPLQAAGVVFDTAGAAFVDADGRPVDPAGTAPGMTVEIDADPAPGGSLAYWVRRAEQLAGAVQAVNAAAGTLQVRAQTVLVTAGTVLDPALGSDWSLLAPGTRIRVWGQLDLAAGRVVASRIDRPEAPDDVVRGVVTAVEPGAVTVGGLRALVPPGLAVPADVVPGAVARLVLTAGNGPVGTLRALRQDAPALPDRDASAVEGRVTAVRSATDFDVDGLRVDASTASIAGGLPAPGRRARVEGRSTAGVLVAATLELEDDEPDSVVELAGTITAVDPTGQRFMVRRTTVLWDTGTQFDSGSPSALRPRRRVELKGRRAPGGGLRAFYIHVEG